MGVGRFGERRMGRPETKSRPESVHARRDGLHVDFGRRDVGAGAPRLQDFLDKEIEAGLDGTLLFEAVQSIGDKDFIKPLENSFRPTTKDSSINPKWVLDLGSCIKCLKEAVKHED